MKLSYVECVRKAGDLLLIDGYTLYRDNRTRNGGGVAVYVSDSLKHSRRNDFPERALETPATNIHR